MTGKPTFAGQVAAIVFGAGGSLILIFWMIATAEHSRQARLSYDACVEDKAQHPEINCVEAHLK